MEGGGSSRVFFTIQCANLMAPKGGRPNAVVLVHDVSDGEAVDLGRTEVIKDEANPRFQHSVAMVFRFAQKQRVRFTVYDGNADRPTAPSSEYRSIGSVEFELVDLVKKVRLSAAIDSGAAKSPGHVIVVAEESRGAKFDVAMQLSAVELDAGGGKPDAFVTISRAVEGGAPVVVYRSEPVRSTPSPKWPRIELSSERLCGGQLERELTVEVHDHAKNGQHKLIGRFTTSVEKMRQREDSSWDLVNAQARQQLEKKGKMYKGNGRVQLLEFELTPTHSIIDYMQGGCSVHLLIGIDFTKSNGNPSDPRSLHYFEPPMPPMRPSGVNSPYMDAIVGVGDILASYQNAEPGLFPTYGFGAVPPGQTTVSHCFPLNGNPGNPALPGINAVLMAYQGVVRSVRFDGPTLLEQLLNTAYELAGSTHNLDAGCTEQKYFVLLVLTDGCVDDESEVIELLVAKSNLPLSVVLVGIGDEDFGRLRRLENFRDMRNIRGQSPKRKTVSVVEFDRFRDQDPRNLTKAVLADIPAQLLSYMRENQLKPIPRLAPTSTLVMPGTSVRPDAVVADAVAKSQANSQIPSSQFPMQQMPPPSHMYMHPMHQPMHQPMQMQVPPPSNSYYSQQMPMNQMPMSQMPMSQMPMSQMPMNPMQMNQMPMSQMQMNPMQMNSMQMNPMQMNSMQMNPMQMNQMPMSQMPMSQMQMNQMPMSQMQMNQMQMNSTMQVPMSGMQGYAPMQGGYGPGMQPPPSQPYGSQPYGSQPYPYPPPSH